MFVLFGLIVAGFTIFHAVKRLKGSKKHRILLVNIVLAAVAAVSFILLEVDQKAFQAVNSLSEQPMQTCRGYASFTPLLLSIRAKTLRGDTTLKRSAESHIPLCKR